MDARKFLPLSIGAAALAFLCALAACSDETGAEEKREPVEASIVLGKTEISDFSEFRVECAVKGKAAGDTVKLSFELPEGFSLRYAADDDPFDPELGGTLRDSDKVVLSDELHLVLLDELDVIVSILVVKPEKKPNSSAKGSSEKGSSGSGSSEEGGSSGEGGSSDSGSSVEESSGSSEALSSSEEPSSSSEAGPEPQLPGWTAAAWGTTSNAMKTAKDNKILGSGTQFQGTANAEVSGSRIVLTTAAAQKRTCGIGICGSWSGRNSTGLLFTGSVSASNAEEMYDASGSAGDFKALLSFVGVPFDGKPAAFELDYVYEHVSAGDQRGLVYVLLLNGSTIVGSGA
ncbi:MAG: hypothetical protein J6V65_03705, partial [Fibrobacterales bacterium]|nr:hypothetical protein [Fibrobacterales bacterium]